MQKKVKETIIRDYGTNNVSFSQTTKGIWHCSGVSIYTDNIWDAITLMDKAIAEISEVLKKHNAPQE